MSDIVVSLLIGGAAVAAIVMYFRGRKPAGFSAAVSAVAVTPGTVFRFRCNDAMTKHVFQAGLPTGPYYTMECPECRRNLYPPELIERNLNELKPSPTELWIDVGSRDAWAPATVRLITELRSPVVRAS